MTLRTKSLTDRKKIAKVFIMTFEEFKEHRKAHPDYKVFWRSGYAFRGTDEREMDTTAPDFIEKIESNFNWACIVDVDKDDPITKELHLNGLSISDME